MEDVLLERIENALEHLADETFTEADSIRRLQDVDGHLDKARREGIVMALDKVKEVFSL